MVEHDGAVPQYIAPNPVSSQAWGIAFQVLEQMSATSGISQWSSQAKASLPGTPSGKALETMDDQQSDRFAHVESGYQQWRVQIGLRHIDLARMLHDEANGKVDKIFDEQPDPIDKKQLAAWIRDNSWPDVDIDGGDYHLTLEPENFITGVRGGKLNEVNEAAKAGLIPDPSLTAALFDEPDIARANRGILGPVHRIERCLSDLADLKVPYIECAPDPEMNLALGKLLALGELEEAKSKRADAKICQRFRDFIADCKRLDDLAKSGAPSLAGRAAEQRRGPRQCGDAARTRRRTARAGTGAARRAADADARRAADGSGRMIDVAKFHVADRCPRCIDRRVLAVDLDRNLWLCAPNAMPIPWRHDHVIEHDAAEFEPQDQVTNG